MPTFQSCCTWTTKKQWSGVESPRRRARVTALNICGCPAETTSPPAFQSRPPRRGDRPRGRGFGWGGAGRY
ncbi:hypothetical protein SKAU_G00339670 [Synaphobranchus kaupii]|uniref:Uncharacterized protein n=1 Tax=Synaphobranchus kaupii TaxID=118154 RepID=A0A9Q1EMV2_SYNKA|nr:hypothetical protein SKAU_G00339670 [Synaphobranchus kaupii]